MLKNVKLGTKLTGGFLVVAALCAFIGGFGMYKLHTIDAAYSVAADANTTNLNAISELRSTFLLVRVGINKAYGLYASDTRRELLDNLETSRHGLHKALSGYESTIDTDAAEYKETDRKLTADVDSTLRAYEAALDKIVAALEANKRDEAHTLLQEAAHTQTPAVNDALDQLLAFNMKMDSDCNKALSANAKSANMMIAVVMVICIVMAMALGVLLSRAITRPMKAMSDVAEKIAMGDVSQTVDYQSGDELGQLAAAFRAMSEMIRNRVSRGETGGRRRQYSGPSELGEGYSGQEPGRRGGGPAKATRGM